MSYTDRHLAAGSWEQALRPGTPRRLLETAITPFSVVAISPVWAPIGGLGDSEILGELAMWSGVYTGWKDRRTVLAGYGAAYMLGTSDGLSNLYETPPTFTTASRTLDDHVTVGVFRTGPGSSMNGITPGTLASTGGAATARVLEIPAGSSPLDYLNIALDHYDGFEFKITPEWVLHVAVPSTLFRQSEVVLSADVRGGFGGETPRNYAATYTPAVDWEQYATRAVVNPTTGSPGSADTSSVPWQGLDGVDIERDRWFDNSTSTSSAQASARAAVILGRYDKTDGRRAVGLELPDAYAARQDIEPGDTVALLDFYQELGEPSGSPMYHRGQYVKPYELRVRALSWEFVTGMGFYVRRSTDGTWFDLSDWVLPGNPGARLEVGSPRRAPRRNR